MRRPCDYHQCGKGCSHRQKAGEKVLSLSYRLVWRAQGSAVQAPDGRQSRKGDDACDKGNAPQHHRWTHPADQSQNLQGPGARSRGPEARSPGNVSRKLIWKEDHIYAYV